MLSMYFYLSRDIVHSYLALVAGVACEADYVFIPEDPPSSDWPQKLCKKLMQVTQLYIVVNEVRMCLFYK